MAELASVAVFAYNRPEHLRQVLSALAEQEEAKQTALSIFADGAKGRRDRMAVEETYRVAARASGFKQVRILSSPKNLGLAMSIVGGVSQILEKEDRVIVLEDDIVPLPGFLFYMNRALNLYGTTDQVMQVSATQYAEPPPQDKCTRFLPVTTSWGWATWQRAWRHYEGNDDRIRKFLRSDIDGGTFDLQNSYPFRRLLEDSVSGRGDTWAVRWYYSCFVRSGLTVYPPVSYVRNIGRDGSGQHDTGPSPVAIPPLNPSQLEWPSQIQTDEKLLDLIQKQFRLAEAARNSQPKKHWRSTIAEILRI